MGNEPYSPPSPAPLSPSPKKNVSGGEGEIEYPVGHTNSPPTHLTALSILVQFETTGRRIWRGEFPNLPTFPLFFQASLSACAIKNNATIAPGACFPIRARYCALQCVFVPALEYRFPRNIIPCHAPSHTHTHTHTHVRLNHNWSNIVWKEFICDCKEENNFRFPP